MSGNMIKTCDCSNPYQDTLYGHNKRVMTIGQRYYTCTACGKETLIISTAKAAATADDSDSDTKKKKKGANKGKSKK